MKKITLVVLSLPFISACSLSIPEFPEIPKVPEIPSMSEFIPDISLPTLFKLDVSQGSILDQFSINKLKVGMSKAEVQDLIGSPTVADPFHKNRWDYINHSTLYKKDNINYRLTLIFDKNTLKNINTSKLVSLLPLTEKEKKLENKRLAKERADAEKSEQAKSIAKIRAIDAKKAAAQAKVIAKAREIANKKAADEAKALAKKRAADKKAADEAKTLAKKRAADKKAADEAKAATREADLKEGYKAYEEAVERAKSLKGPNTPWYRF